MREIKFRAYDTKLKMMFPPLTFSKIAQIGQKPDDTTIFMQFTGLYDKNGREVYEGDIVRYTYRLSNNAPDLFLEYLIKWDDKNFKFNKFFKKDDGGWEADIFTGLWFEGTRLMYEVIGNIYENPELLKEGETK